MNKKIPQFTFITEELIQAIEQIEARQKYLEVGFDKIWKEMQEKTTGLGKALDKTLEQMDRLITIVQAQNELQKIKEKKK